MATLDDIRKKLLADDPEKRKQNNPQQANEMYPFWNIPEGTTATMRFLPDGDSNNTLFWVERQIIHLPFNGIKGKSGDKVIVQVPCVDMWDEPCPIHKEIRPWFNDKETEELARVYWKKRSYLFQGFVCSSSLEEQNVPENPIRRFVINKSIYTIIKSSLMDTEMEDIPTDYVNGCDFKLTKTTKGKFADYSTSNWSRKSRALSDVELAAIDQFGLFDLKAYLPNRPGPRELEIIKDMFQASVNDEPYDEDEWGNFYRPRGAFGDNKANTPSQTREVPSTGSDDDTPFEKEKPVSALDKLKSRVSKSDDDEPVASSEKPDAKDILAMIKKRSAK